MTAPLNDGLAKITVATPTRRVDVALPESVPVIELMVTLLRISGDGLADDGQRTGGWILRTTDGDAIDFEKTLSEQSIRDGQILHLVPRQKDWPPLDYDDVVDAIATGARSQTRVWGAAATRRAGTVAAATALVLALALLATSGPPWRGPSLVAIGGAAALLATSYAFSRAFADQAAAMLASAGAVLFAGAGGLLLFAGTRSLTELEASHFLSAGALLTLTAILGIAAVGHRVELLVAGALVGVVTMISAALAYADAIGGISASAIALTLVLVVTPAWPLLSIRLGKLPVPPLPRTAEELLADPPQPALADVHGSVRRSDEILTGLLTGSAVVAVVTQFALALAGDISAFILVILASISSLLRARLFPTIRHRAPLLAAGILGLVATVLSVAGSTTTSYAYTLVPALLVVGLIVIGLSRYFAVQPPSPVLGRLADIFDVLIAVGIVPVMCLVVGLFGYLRGLYG
ncbi:type VII secretion integral membrane protein EccD [Epidermidibacterium keratini]|uniref:Type VII secretion integral membrane protein EccD n=1 Tax=Epidermidibacterium keratini TaxID=1891644 RepID=A0A7L4YPQ7_9ACTN|nr:type VII secretion integral membrane protein EccD [Epidermidibacterium keratini]QHC00874.1 type VII secretion integral membrane protein EccD [Epidermidibacterium keratini]